MWIADRLRDADKAEVRAATGKSPREVIEDSVVTSKLAFTVRKTRASDPFAIFGVSDAGMVDGAYFGLDRPAVLVGLVWMVGTPEMEKNRIAIAKESRWWIDLLGKNYDALYNLVYAENSLHRKWLDFTGFKFMPGVPFGPNDEFFIPFFRLTETTQA